MHHYRAYILDHEGHIIRPVDLFCDNDDAAKDEARLLVAGHDVELWQLDRKISVFSHGPE
jgi:hypothetical protein